MSGWNGHWSTSLQNNQRLSGCAFTSQDTRSLTSNKPPRSRFTPTAIPAFPHPSLYVGDFNCQHVNWGDNKPSSDGGRDWTLGQHPSNVRLLYEWPKGNTQFILWISCFIGSMWMSSSICKFFFLLSKLLWHVFKTCRGSRTKEIHPHTKPILNFTLETTDGWSQNYCKKLLWWVNWIFHSEKNIFIYKKLHNRSIGWKSINYKQVIFEI